MGGFGWLQVGAAAWATSGLSVAAPVAVPEPDGPAVVEAGSVDDASTAASPDAAASWVSLSWEAPASCPDADAVHRDLAHYLGPAPAAGGGPDVRASARVVDSDEGFALSLRTETSSGVTIREMADEHCEVLVEATALIIAIAIDPDAVINRGPPPEPVPPPEPTPPTEPEPEPEGPVADEPAPLFERAEAPVEPPPEPVPPPPPVRFGMQVMGGAIVGSLPGVAGGLRGAGAVLGRRWRAELVGDYWLPRTRIAEQGVGGRIALWSFGARGCWVPVVSVLEFPLCGGAEAGAMRGDPVGDRVAGGQTSRRPWVAADAAAGLTWVPRRFLAIGVRAELAVPLLRTGFRVGEVEVHQAGPVSGRVLAGLEARFP